jgi:hypothetical protein
MIVLIAIVTMDRALRRGSTPPVVPRYNLGGTTPGVQMTGRQRRLLLFGEAGIREPATQSRSE